MPDIGDSQGATLTFDGVELGTYISMSPSFSAGTVHETTNVTSPIYGSGANSRVQKQYNCTSVEPGQVVVKFLGNVDISFGEMGREGWLEITWPGGNYAGYGFATQLDGDVTAGEIIKWSMLFRFSGYF
jgi:hypothetical protein